ncbi:MAG: hypothetical protein ABWY19_06670 [Marmoricola sp.]
MTEGPVRRPRHLLDPEDLRRSHQRSQGTQESLGNVQKWVMSALAVTTIAHLAGGVAILAISMDDAPLDARIGLNVVAAFIGVAAVATGLMIHGKKPLSWWLLLGLLPGIVGAWFTF